MQKPELGWDIMEMRGGAFYIRKHQKLSVSNREENLNKGLVKQQCPVQRIQGDVW